jgi:flagellar L-ring protein precursor FlgH
MAMAVLILSFGPAGWALGQSSSLFKQSQEKKTEEQAATTKPASNGTLPANAGATSGQPAEGNKALKAASLTAVKLPEPKIIMVNDFVGVVVRYQLRQQSSSKIKQDSKWDVNAKLAAWFRLHDRKWQQQDFQGGTPEVKFNEKNKLDNQGEANRKDMLETRVMAKVIDIKPNGTLVIVAWSRMEMDDEVQYLRLTGECNRDDITADGNVTSDKIYGPEVRIMNDGAVKDAVKRGWFKEILDTAKPF